MRRTSMLLLLLSACAVGTQTVERPVPPIPEGRHPAVGRELDLRLGDPDAAVRLTGVVGRATLVCVLPGGSVERACARAAREWQDRLAVVGVATDPAVDLAALPFRTFLDWGGEALESSLELSAEPRIVVVDKRGRIVELLDPGGLEGLDEAIRGVVF